MFRLNVAGLPSLMDHSSVSGWMESDNRIEVIVKVLVMVLVFGAGIAVLREKFVLGPAIPARHVMSVIVPPPTARPSM